MTSTLEIVMNLRKGSKKFRLVGWLSVSQLIGWGTLYYAFTLFNGPLNHTFGWSASEINIALTIGFISWAVTAPFVGKALDQFGGQKVMSFGTGVGVVALIFWAHAASLFAFYFSWVLMGIAMACSLYESAFYVLTRSFPDKYKKVITWLTLVGGFASTIFIPLVDYLIQLIGWQQALLTLASLNLVVVLPIHWWKLPNRKRSKYFAGGKKLLDFELFSEPSFKKQTFWGLNLWFVVFNSITTGVTFLLIPLLTEVGTEMSLLILSYSLIGPMQVFGRLALIWFDSKDQTLKLGVITTLMAFGGIGSVALFPQDLLALLFFSLLFGTSKGIMTIIKGTAVAEQMNLSVYGRTNGWLSLSSMLFKAATPMVVATLWTWSGKPILMLWGISGISLIALGGLALIKKDTV
jgi:MFS family permease